MKLSDVIEELEKEKGPKLSTRKREPIIIIYIYIYIYFNNNNGGQIPKSHNFEKFR